MTSKGTIECLDLRMVGWMDGRTRVWDLDADLATAATAAPTRSRLAVSSATSCLACSSPVFGLAQTIHPRFPASPRTHKFLAGVLARDFDMMILLHRLFPYCASNKVAYIQYHAMRCPRQNALRLQSLKLAQNCSFCNSFTLCM